MIRSSSMPNRRRYIKSIARRRIGSWSRSSSVYWWLAGKASSRWRTIASWSYCICWSALIFLKSLRATLISDCTLIHYFFLLTGGSSTLTIPLITFLAWRRTPEDRDQDSTCSSSSLICCQGDPPRTRRCRMSRPQRSRYLVAIAQSYSGSSSDTVAFPRFQIRSWHICQ